MSFWRRKFYNRQIRAENDSEFLTEKLHTIIKTMEQKLCQGLVERIKRDKKYCRITDHILPSVMDMTKIF